MQAKGASAPWQVINEGSQGANQQYIAAENNALQKFGDAEKSALQQFGKNYFAPFWKTGSAANTLYADAMGLNGPQGVARAQGAFQTGPGYQFALQQGLQGVDRGASAKGFLGSGNAVMALNDYAQGMANQEYGNWLANLGGISTRGLAAAQGTQDWQKARADINLWGGEKGGGTMLWGGEKRGESILSSSQLIGKLWQDSIEREKDRQIQRQAQKQSLIMGLLGSLGSLGSIFGK